ncbi:MAG: flagellar hook-associated protein FlgK [Holosporales bacterium]
MAGVTSSSGLLQASNAALTGMNTASALIAVSSGNIVNASTPNYTRKESQVSTNVTGGIVIGVTANVPERIVDEIRISQFREQESNIQYQSTKNEILGVITQGFGRPGDGRSLGNLAAKVMNSAGALALSPESDALKNEFLTDLKVYTQSINKVADNIQAMRTQCESGINDMVMTFNSQLEIVQRLNQEIARNAAQGLAIGDFEDQRDTALLKISSMMNINVIKMDNGEVTVQTSSGMPLVQGSASEVTFSPATVMDAGIKYDPTLPGSLSGLMVNNVDITKYIRTGSMAAYFELRDSILPKIQKDIDTLAEQVRDQLNAIHNQGAGYPTRSSMTGTRRIANTGDPFTGTGTLRLAVVNNTNRQVVEFVDIDLTTTTNHAAVVGAINAGLTQGIASWNSEGQLNLALTDPTQNYGFAMVSVGASAVETTTGLGFSHYYGLNDLLVNKSRYIQDGNPIGNSGLANDLSVNSAFLQSSSAISRGVLNDAPTLAIGEPAVTAGDSRIISALANKFKANLAFPAGGNLTPRSTSFIDYANEMIGVTALMTNDAATLAAAEEDIQKQLETTIGAISGVNIQEELAKMMNWQRLYITSVQVSRVAQDVMDQLLKLGG